MKDRIMITTNETYPWSYVTQNGHGDIIDNINDNVNEKVDEEQLMENCGKENLSAHNHLD
jgi:hypothetical protein